MSRLCVSETREHVDVVCRDVLWMNGRLELRSEWIMQPPASQPLSIWPRPPPFLCHEPGPGESSVSVWRQGVSVSVMFRESSREDRGQRPGDLRLGSQSASRHSSSSHYLTFSTDFNSTISRYSLDNEVLLSKFCSLFPWKWVEILLNMQI